MATKGPAVRKMLKLVSGNAKKVDEVKAVLEPTIEVYAVDIDLPEYQGEPREVAIQKCLAAAAVVNGPVLVEDTCLCYNAFGGLPGVYIKWFLKNIGPEGLFNMLKMWPDKSGYALCTFAYSDGKDPTDRDAVRIFEGRCDGTIVWPRGARTFGWDPIFEPMGSTRTFGEMTMEEKNLISHRGKALAKLKNELLPSLLR